MEHPDTLVSASNLANTLYAQGLHEQATILDRETWGVRKRLLGAEHPETLASANNLANTLRVQGQLDEAAALLRETLEAKRRVMGAEQPDTLETASDLARTLHAQGFHREAAALDRETLAVRKRVLGDEHPGTLASASNLANTLFAEGLTGEAVKLHSDTLAMRRRVFGMDHPDTLAIWFYSHSGAFDQVQHERLGDKLSFLPTDVPLRPRRWHAVIYFSCFACCWLNGVIVLAARFFQRYLFAWKMARRFRLVYDCYICLNSYYVFVVTSCGPSAPWWWYSNNVCLLEIVRFYWYRMACMHAAYLSFVVCDPDL